jgi:predicted ABC-class ATPase
LALSEKQVAALLNLERFYHLNFGFLPSKSESTSIFMSGRGRGGRGGRGDGGGRSRGGGRGEYYKNKYGGGGRGGRGGNRDDNNNNNNSQNSSPPQGGGSYADLEHCLRRLDGKSYGAYHDLDTPSDLGWTNHSDGFTLFVERAQADPFAAPTRCRVIVDAAKAAFPPEAYSNRIRAMATCDFLLRNLYGVCKLRGADAALGGQGWSGPKGGDIQILEAGQHVLEQSAIRIDTKTGNVIAQLTINLPARGRTILGHAAESILLQTLPVLVQQSLVFQSLSKDALKRHVHSVEDQCWLQNRLESRNLVAFVRNGAILPRQSGVDDRPMDAVKAIRFESPERLEVSFDLPNAGTTISGMGIPKGITLICGGGFHGKSTLLEALQVGIYPKIPGDGREFCAMSPKSAKIRSEDGRNVQSVDISTFINNLPFGKDTACFSTPDASGSTSQATNILEVSL